MRPRPAPSPHLDILVPLPPWPCSPTLPDHGHDVRTHPPASRARHGAPPLRQSSAFDESAIRPLSSNHHALPALVTLATTPSSPCPHLQLPAAIHPKAPTSSRSAASQGRWTCSSHGLIVSTTWRRCLPHHRTAPAAAQYSFGRPPRAGPGSQAVHGNGPGIRLQVSVGPPGTGATSGRAQVEIVDVAVVGGWPHRRPRHLPTLLFPRRRDPTTIAACRWRLRGAMLSNVQTNPTHVPRLDDVAVDGGSTYLVIRRAAFTVLPEPGPPLAHLEL